MSDDPHAVELFAEARRSLRRLPSKIAPAIVEFITGPLADNPARLSKPLTGELTGYRTARRGNYRVLLRIDPKAHTILVVRIDHRVDVYPPQ